MQGAGGWIYTQVNFQWNARARGFSEALDEFLLHLLPNARGAKLDAAHEKSDLPFRGKRKICHAAPFLPLE